MQEAIVRHYEFGNKIAECWCAIYAMDTIDIRRESKGGQQVLRRQVIAARKQGKTYREIHQAYGVQPGTACDWWGRYQAEGEAFITADRCGRPKVQRDPPECPAVSAHSATDHGQDARSAEAAVCPMDPARDPGTVWCICVPAHGGRIPQTLELYTAAPCQARLRAVQ